MLKNQYGEILTSEQIFAARKRGNPNAIGTTALTDQACGANAEVDVHFLLRGDCCCYCGASRNRHLCQSRTSAEQLGVIKKRGVLRR